MGRILKVFLRVIRSYSINEKVLSIVLLIALVVAVVQGVTELFKTPEFLFGEGGVYTEGVISDNMVVLNPMYVDFSDANRDLASLIFSGLTKYDPDKQAFVPDMAELTVSGDKKTYRFVLHQNLYWQDGQPLTADDVYFTYHDVIQSPDFQNPVLRADFQGVDVKEVDPRTIDFVLDRPNSFFITNTGAGILPKHILGQTAVADMLTDTFNLKPVGSGRYRVDAPMENLPDGRQRVVLTLNDTYYGDHPKIKLIRFNIYPDSQSLIKDVSTLNVISKVPKDVWDSLDVTNRFEFSNYELPQYTAIFFNMDSPVLKKDKVRLALQKSLDRDALIKQLYNKTPVDTPLMELNQSDWIYKMNLDEAKGALFDSGWKINQTVSPQFRTDSKGNVMKLVLLARQYQDGSVQVAETQQITDFFKKSWEGIGIQVDVQYEDTDAFNNRLAARDYDMVLAGQSLGYNYDTFSYWHSSQSSGVGLNLSNYRSFAADALIEKIRDTFDPNMKNELIRDLAKEISQDIPAIFLFRPSYVFASDGKVKGMELKNMASVSDRFAHMERWCINCQ